MSNATLSLPISFLPSISTRDHLAAYWLRNVTLRLRREIAWLWRERSMPAASAEQNGGIPLPPITDRLESSLDLSRHAIEKQSFFADDETAAYLSDLIAQPPPRQRREPARGSFSWVAQELALTDFDCFVLALALSPVVDSAAGPIFSTCLNDATRQYPTYALAQRLWHNPQDLFALGNPTHPLFSHGVLSSTSAGNPLVWEAPLLVHALHADCLLHGTDKVRNPVFTCPLPDRESVTPDVALTVARLRKPAAGIRLLPLIGPRGASYAEAAAAILERANLTLVVPPAGVSARADTWLAPTLTLAWLHGASVYLELESLFPASNEAHGAYAPSPTLPSLPIVVCLGTQDPAALKRLPAAHVLPAYTLPASTFRQRVNWWNEHLPASPADTERDSAIADVSRRFRYEKRAIVGLCEDLTDLGRPISASDLTHACRADLDLGDLAQPVTPRFVEADLMLPPKQTRQLGEMIQAMRALTTVHFEWGTERAWNQSGLTALFAGPPGTGKTMCAEVIAEALQLPMYRIDLSQVVNKYIGETEKNLRKLFDAAEASDVILFFDEADSLFGKRTEVKDAHDRYANLEVSYLLERMERFKGLAILATNRKRDLDEAFLRRLRFLIDFPLPGAEERLRIWKQVMPAGVDTTEVDFTFLAQRFPLAGGHIRSIVFHACLQVARPGAPRKLSMEPLIAAVKREYDKLDRSMSLEQFGPYAAIAAQLL